MSFVRKIKRADCTHYAEVKNAGIKGRAVQKHIRYISKDPDVSRNFTPYTVHFGYIATRLTQGDLTANELIDMIEAGWGTWCSGRIWRLWAYVTVLKKTVLRSPSTTPGSQESAAVRRVRQRACRGEDIQKKGDHALRLQ